MNDIDKCSLEDFFLILNTRRTCRNFRYTVHEQAVLVAKFKRDVETMFSDQLKMSIKKGGEGGGYFFLITAYICL